MDINQFRLNNLRVTPTISSDNSSKTQQANTSAKSSFKDILQQKLDNNQSVEFSKHAMQRIEERNIDMDENNKIERLNKAVQLAESKGANETLVLIDKTAFVVNIKNNKVITTLSDQDMKENVFTNIDSTVIM